MKRRGFTLTETLIAIAVVAALAAVAWPAARGVLARAHQAACLGKLNQIGTGLELYLQDHNRILPAFATGRASRQDPAPVLETGLIPYLDGPESFRCPADPAEFTRTGSSYIWNSTQSNQPESSLSFFGIEGKPRQIPLVSDKEAWHPGGGGVNLLYADGSASREIRFRTTNNR